MGTRKSLSVRLLPTTHTAIDQLAVVLGTSRGAVIDELVGLGMRSKHFRDRLSAVQTASGKEEGSDSK